MSQSAWARSFTPQEKAAANKNIRAKEDREALENIVTRIEFWTNSHLNESFAQWRFNRDRVNAEKKQNLFPDLHLLYSISNGRYICNLVLKACEEISLDRKDIDAVIEGLTARFVEPNDLKSYQSTNKKTSCLVQSLDKAYEKEKSFPCAATDHTHMYNLYLVLLQHMANVTGKCGFSTPMEEKLMADIESGIARAVDNIDAGRDPEDYLIPKQIDPKVPYIENSLERADQWLKAQKITVDKKIHDLYYDRHKNDGLTNDFNMGNNLFASAVFTDLLNFLHSHKSLDRWQVFFEKAAHDLIYSSDDYLEIANVPAMNENIGIQSFFQSWFECFLDPQSPNAATNRDPVNLQVITVLADAINRDFPTELKPMQKAAKFVH